MDEINREFDLWKMQNLFYQLSGSLFVRWQEQAAQGDARANEFIWFFRLLAGRLNISLERFEVGVYA